MAAIRSTDRILTTHTGSLPRPTHLVQLIYAREAGEVVNEADFAGEVRDAVTGIVDQQIASGLDIINDGEQGKVMYSMYVKDRCSGFEANDLAPAASAAQDLHEFPEFMAKMHARRGGGRMRRPACNGPIAYTGNDELQTELANFKAALSGKDPADTFMSSASPGVIELFMGNTYYKTREEFIWALAEALKTEYDAIHQAGFVLQLDCPDLAVGRHGLHQKKTLAEFRDIIKFNIDALNHATRDIPAESMRLHVCWGNYEGPHHYDVPFADIIDLVLQARPAGIVIEAANPRHAWEWQVFENTKLPDGKYIVAGCLDTTTNFIEHPELVAQRILNYARLVGRENVMAGTDCGFSTAAGAMNVDPGIVWKKFEAMAEGAAIASKKLWT